MGNSTLRLSYEQFSFVLMKNGHPKKEIRRVIKEMIEAGYVEGDDETGYVLTDKGVLEAERHIYNGIGVV